MNKKENKNASQSLRSFLMNPHSTCLKHSASPLLLHVVDVALVLLGQLHKLLLLEHLQTLLSATLKFLGWFGLFCKNYRNKKEEFPQGQHPQSATPLPQV